MSKKTIHYDRDSLTRLGNKRRAAHLIDKNQTIPKRKRTDLPDAFPSGKTTMSSYLVDDTDSMDRARRLMEQEVLRQQAKVHARAHNENEPQNTPEGDLQNSIKQHPSARLNSQRYDGIDPNLNPEPPLNTDARREYDNAEREQLQKKLDLGLTPKHSSTPTPRPQ